MARGDPTTTFNNMIKKMWSVAAGAHAEGKFLKGERLWQEDIQQPHSTIWLKKCDRSSRFLFKGGNIGGKPKWKKFHGFLVGSLNFKWKRMLIGRV